jgi:SAM-dependent methyltransferase
MPDTGEPGSPETGLDPATQRQVVRERYARIATRTGSADEDCCSGDECCRDDDASSEPTDRTAELIGYSTDELDAVSGDANLNLGCGNPKALASLSPGETVLDLGSGAGFDCFLAGQEVGETGHVVGVDMTVEMVEKARENARQNETDHVEFRLGEIEHLPVADERVDVVISNCVVNLSPDKPQVFREAYRVLRPGGRLAISDVVLTADVPAAARADPESVASCVAGASRIEHLEGTVRDAGFEAVDVEPNDDSDRFIRDWDEERDLSEFLVSATITGRKPPATDREA